MTDEPRTTIGEPGEVTCPWCDTIVENPFDLYPGEAFACRNCRKIVEVAAVKFDVTVTLTRR